MICSGRCLFRCSTFWAFSLSVANWMTTQGLEDRFRCSMFWAFSLSSGSKESSSRAMTPFRCSIFWAFSLLKPSDTLLWLEMCFDAQCFELFLYWFWKDRYFLRGWVSMLNVLSFFFIIGLIFMIRYSGAKSFDAQCSELFLYIVKVECIGMYNMSFDAQCSELFLYPELLYWKEIQ